MHLQHNLKCALHIDEHITVHVTVHIDIASRAKYHKQIKFIHNHREEIRAKNIATLFLNKDFSAYYHSVNLLKGKGKNSCPVIDGHSTNKEIADCFAESY